MILPSVYNGSHLKLILQGIRMIIIIEQIQFIIKLV